MKSEIRGAAFHALTSTFYPLLFCYQFINFTNVLHLNNYKKSITWYMRSLELVISKTMSYYDFHEENNKAVIILVIFCILVKITKLLVFCDNDLNYL